MVTATERSMERREYASQFTLSMFGRKISWSGILAGVFAGTFMQVLLGSLGAGIGATAVAASDSLGKGTAISAGLWVLASSVISSFVAGWVAGRMSNSLLKREGSFHGFLTSAVGTLFMMLLLGSAIGGVFGTVSNLAGSGLQASAPNGRIARQIRNATGDMGIQTNGDTAANAEVTANRAATGTATAGYGLFLLLFLGSAAAIFGGYAGVPSRKTVTLDPTQERSI